MTSNSPPSRRERVSLGLGWLAAFAWWGSAAAYGIDLSDEGYIVYPAAQVAAGLVPYRDINSLYTPLTWYLHAALFQVAGVELLPLRLFFAAVVAGLVVGVYLLARQHTRPWLAAVPAAAYVLALPLPQVWAPYPAWYALGGLLTGLLALGRWLEDRRDRWLVVAGLGCAWAFGTKPSLGLFGLAAFGGFLLLRAGTLSRPPAGPGAGAGTGGAPWLAGLQYGAVLAVSTAVWLLVRGVTSPGNQALLVGTMVLAGLAAVERRCGPVDLPTVARQTAHRWGWLVGTFLLATALWYVPLSIAAGWGLTFDTIFRAGARTAAAFNQPIDLPNGDAVEVLLLALLAAALVAAAGWAGARQRLGWRVAAAMAGLAVTVVLAFGVVRGQATGLGLGGYLLANLQGRLARNASEETDLLMYLPFVLAWLGAGALLVRRARGRRTGDADPCGRDAHLALLVWVAPLILLQVYPHASYRHVQFSIGPFLALAGVLRADLWTWAAPRLPSAPWRVAAAALLLVFPAVLVPTALRARATTTALAADLGQPHARGLRVADADRARMAFVAERFAALPPGAPVFAYPAMPMVYLLTGHPNPTRESYLPPGYVDEERQRDVMARLDATATRYVVWDRDLVRQWGLTPTDQPLVDYLWSRYSPVAEEGSWVFLERR